MVRVRLWRSWRASCALVIGTVVAAVGTAVVGGPAVARTPAEEPPSVSLTTLERWLPAGTQPIGGPVVGGPVTDAPVAGTPSGDDGAPAGDAADAGSGYLRLRVVRPAAEDAALPVLLVAEHAPQRHWDRWAAKGFAVVHLELPTDRRGCIDAGGPADGAAMRSAVQYLVGAGPGFADRSTNTPTPADFSDGRIAAVGDATGGTPFALGSAGVRAVIGIDAVAIGYAQQRWRGVADADLERCRLTSAASAASSAAAPSSAPTEVLRPQADPWWKARTHLPVAGYVAPTLIVQHVGAETTTSAAQGLAVAAALREWTVTHQLYLTSGSDQALPDAAIDTWLGRFVLGRSTPEQLAPVVVQRDEDAPVGMDTWPYPDAELGELTAAGSELSIRRDSDRESTVSGARLSTSLTSADLVLAGVPTVEFRGAGVATARLEIVRPDSSTTSIARGSVDAASGEPAQRIALSPTEAAVPTGSRIELVLDGEPDRTVDQLVVWLPVRGGPTALTAALSNDQQASETGSATPPATAEPSPPTTAGPTSLPNTTESVPPPSTAESTSPGTGPTSTSSPATASAPTRTTTPAAHPTDVDDPTDPTSEEATSTGSAESTESTESTGSAESTEAEDPIVGDAGSEPTESAEPGSGTAAEDTESTTSAPAAAGSGSAPTVTGTGSIPALPSWAQRSSQPDLPPMLSMSITDVDPVTIQAISLTGVDSTTTGSLHPVRVLDPGVGVWNLTGQVSDFRSADGTILADNLGWQPKVSAEFGERTAIRPGPAAAPGRGTGLGDVRVLCSGTGADSPTIASCSGDLELGVPATARSGEYTALLTLTLI